MCECDKSCDIEEYLDYKNCVIGIRTSIADKLVEECANVVMKMKLIMKLQTFHQVIISVGLAHYTLYYLLFLFNNECNHWLWFYLFLLLAFRKKKKR